MKAISVKQPWALLLISGVKAVENRSWEARYRGPLLIQASKSPLSDRTLRHMLASPKWRGYGVKHRSDFHYGAILGAVILTGCKRVEELPPGEFTDGPWCLLVKDPVRLDKPIPYKGMLGLFDVPDEVLPKEFLEKVKAKH
jgi:ASCH domain